MQVQFHYTIFSESGSILDSNRDGKPVSIILGKGQFIPFVEDFIAQAEAGHTYDLMIPRDKGFGEHNPDLVKETDAANLPEQLQQVGTLVELVDDLGQQRNAKVIAAEGDRVTLDFNHPFSGQDLVCSLTLISKTTDA
jgi:FKBP-type peptidyl-prolyl cis-trans isomerase SlpA